MEKEQEHPRTDRETQQHSYEDFCKWWKTDAASIFRDHLTTVQMRYDKDIARWLRSDDKQSAMKARLAQQAKDILENVMTIHVDEVRKKLTPTKEEDSSPIY